MMDDKLRTWLCISFVVMIICFTGYWFSVMEVSDNGIPSVWDTAFNISLVGFLFTMLSTLTLSIVYLSNGSATGRKALPIVALVFSSLIILYSCAVILLGMILMVLI